MAKRNTLFKILLLELICYVPLAIIAGNILPPIGFIKIHWVYIGIVFLLALSLLLANRRATDLLILILAFMLVQIFTSIKFSIKEYIDFISGPLIFITAINIITEDSIRPEALMRIRKKMLYFFSIPIILAFLQYIKVLPLEFMNAKYVNVTIYGEETIDRVNGFLYHGIELAVIIFFFFVSVVAMKTAVKPYLILLLLILVEFITTIKTGIISALLFTGFFSFFIDSKYKFLKSIAIGAIVILGFSYLYILIPDIKEQRFNFDPSEFRFEEQLFTGRGYIWNVYMEGVRHFTPLQILFGGGYGSVSTIYEKYSPNHVEWSAGTHNQILELFVNGGLFAIILMTIIVRKQYLKMRQTLNTDKKTFDGYFFATMLIPLLTMGLTSPIMSMFVYWCGLCAVMITLKLKFSNTNWG